MLTKMILATTATVLVGIAASNAAVAAQKPYQITKLATCSGVVCNVNFDPLTTPVLLKRVSCQFVGGGDSTAFILASLNANNKSGIDTEFQQINYIGGNSLVGQFYFTNSSSFLFGDTGGYFYVTVEFPVTNSLQCTISGDYIDAKASGI
jgi:hypothetical protein